MFYIICICNISLDQFKYMHIRKVETAPVIRRSRSLESIYTEDRYVQVIHVYVCLNVQYFNYDELPAKLTTLFNFKTIR